MKVLFPYPNIYGTFPDIFEYVENLRAMGIDAGYIGWKYTGSRIEFLRQLASRIKEAEPDIVHVFHFRSSGLLPLLVRDGKIKWIIDVRTVHVENRRLEPEKYPWLKTRITWLETQTYNHIFALTPTIKKWLQPSIRPISLVPLGADVHKLRDLANVNSRMELRTKLGIPQDAKVFLYSGSLSPSRQVDKVIRAFAKLVANGFISYFVFIGGVRSVDEQRECIILKSYADLCERLGIGEYVRFTGWMPYDEAVKYYSIGDVGVVYLPPKTVYTTQPPTKLIEYMAAGLLAVGNNVPGVTEFIRDQETGILCENSVEELTEGMRRALQVLNDPQSLQRIKQTAWESVRDRDWKYIVQNYVMPVYMRLLK